MRLLASLSFVKLTVNRYEGEMNGVMSKAAEGSKEIEFTSDARVSSCSFEIKRRFNVARHKHSRP